MSAPAKSNKTSRWGSLLQGAVANLESRLDTILAEEGASKRILEPARPATPEQPRTSIRNGTRTSTDQRESPKPYPLDKAAAHVESQRRTSQDTLAPYTTPQISVDSVRSDEDVAGTTVEDEHDQDAQLPTSLSSTNVSAMGVSSRVSLDTNLPFIHVLAGQEPALPGSVEEIAPEEDLSAAEYQAQIAQSRSDYETVEMQREEEMHAYLERIDALQSKLQYMANEASESARLEASEAPSDSHERRLAIKDEQIALLMAEGQKLSKTEMDLSTIIRKLRVKVVEDGRSFADARRKLANAEKAATDSAEKITRLEASQREAVTKATRLSRFEREAEEFRRVRDTKDATIEGLQKQLDSTNSKVEEEQKQANAQALAAERKITQSLRGDLDNVKIEKQLKEDKSRAHLRAATEELLREKERNFSLEGGLRNEISVLEGKLEIFRVRNEEASSATTGDSQAKLMRQIETLQSQYSQARDNWQGIESSLQARLTTLESEKNEASRQEAEARRKARETGSSSRRLQDQLDDSVRKCSVMVHELSERQASAERLQTRVAEYEKKLQDAKAEYEWERQSWEANVDKRIEEEKTKWRQEATQAPPSMHGTMDSQTLSYNRKSYGGIMDMPLFPPTRRILSRNLSVTEMSLPILERQTSYNNRRSSARYSTRSPETTTPNGFESGRSTPHMTINIPETPSIRTVDEDDMFDNHSSTHHTVNDMISGSTAAAGPSVALVERLSSSARRLESEKAALKDELARLSVQRDEARKEVVSLMREVEEKRAVDEKVIKLEKDKGEIGQRYQTTLEMLGEKSERVEELEADVADLKKIYRQLVDSTMK